MYTIEQMQDLGKRLRETVGLPYSPVAVRVYESEEEVPAEAIRPYRDQGVHYGYCQAVSLVKTTGVTIALAKEDHWCWKPLMAFGLVDVVNNPEVYHHVLRNCGCATPDLADQHFRRDFIMMNRNDNRVIVLAPLEKASFVPDVVMAYADSIVQIRDMIAGIKRRTGKLVHSDFDYMDSCCYSFMPTHFERDFRITFPDPCETGRACCGETEIILSIPYEKLEMVVEECEAKKEHSKNRPLKQDGTIHPDFPRPEFYNELYKLWGLQTGEVSWREDQRGYKI